MTLNEVERQSAVWKKIEAYLNERLEICRKKNDGDLGELETARLRGEIKAIKNLRLIGETLPVTDADSE